MLSNRVKCDLFFKNFYFIFYKLFHLLPLPLCIREVLVILYFKDELESRILIKHFHLYLHVIVYAALWYEVAHYFLTLKIERVGSFSLLLFHCDIIIYLCLFLFFHF